MTIPRSRIIIPNRQVEELFNLDSLSWCSSQVHVGAHSYKNRSTDDVERFMSSIRFENREIIEELGLDL